MVALFKKRLDLEVRTIFLDPEDKLAVMDVSNSESGAFRLIAIYVFTGPEQPNFFRCLEVFFGTSRSLISLMLVNDWNAILDAHLDRVALIEDSV